MSNNFLPKLRFKEFTEAWKSYSLKEVADFFNGKRIPIESEKRVSGEYPYYGATGIIDYVDSYIFEGEYVLLAEDGANIITRNSPIAYLTSGKFWVNNHAHIMQSKNGSNIFLAQVLENQNYVKYNSGTAQPKLNSQVLKEMDVILPESREQTEIGSFFKNLDDTISLHQQELEALKQTKQGFLQKMFPKKGETVPEFRFKEFNNDWQTIRLGEAKDVRDGTHDSPKYYETGFPLVTSKNLKMYGLDLDDISFISPEDYESINKRSKVDVGDILFGMIGTIGNPVILHRDDFAIKNVALIKRGGSIQNQFLVQLLKSHVFKHFIENENVGNTQKFIGLSKIRNFETLIPSQEEQIKIGEFFRQLDEVIELKEKEIEALKETKKGFLQKMFV